MHDYGVITSLFFQYVDLNCIGQQSQQNFLPIFFAFVDFVDLSTYLHIVVNLQFPGICLFCQLCRPANLTYVIHTLSTLSISLAIVDFVNL